MKRIVCIGNRYAPQDGAGPAVFDRLSRAPLPPDVELIDGGLGGLDLLRFVDGAERVVFVDAVAGFAAPGQVAVLSAREAAEAATGAYDHAAGLAWLLRALPLVCAEPLPEIALVGIEGEAGGAAIERAALLAIGIVTNGLNALEATA
jgi:hydrogenase maturation protease